MHGPARLSLVCILHTSSEDASSSYSLTHRLIVLERSLELAQRHVGSGPAVVALDVVLVYLQGLGSIRQGIAIALCAQVRQASVAVVDGIGGIGLHSLRVVLDGILIVFICKERKTWLFMLVCVLLVRSLLREEAFNYKLKSYST